MGFIAKFFKFNEQNTDLSTEVLAGLTTFMTMAYILAVNPDILGNVMDKGGVFTATAIAAFIGTACMALLANYPFALAPGMGLNAYFAFTVASKYGWQLALMAVLAEGVIFMLLSVVNVREAIFNSIPKNMKLAVSVGIGLFICFIGLKSGGMVVNNDVTTVALGNVKSVPVLLFIAGCIIMVVLNLYKVKGALLIGILATYVLGLLCELTGIYTPEVSLIPHAIVELPPSLSQVNIFAALKDVDFSSVGIFNFIAIIFAFLFVDIFDTIGTLIGVSEKAGFLNKEGKLPKLKQALLADAIATTAGAALGTSTVTTYVESASGVADGGRTGFSALVTGVLFLVSLFFWPIFKVIPSFATAPALVVVGLFMVEGVSKIDFRNFDEAFPAFITIVMMPFTYSISEGLVFGMLSYVIIKILFGKWKQISPVMYVIAALFVLKIVFVN